MELVGVKFRQKNKIYYFKNDTLELKKNDKVIVKTSRGEEFAVVNCFAKLISDESLYKEVKRKANPNDLNKNNQNSQLEKEAFKHCQKKINEMNLAMKLIDCEYTFNREQLLFNFLSEERIDFRLLVKDLAVKFKTRIELHQVGVRDKAKHNGGLGVCGRILCCTSFLGELTTVSINMAKMQNLSLNPNKINGQCNRLLCCLTFENDVYKELKKKLPDFGSMYKSELGVGKVINVNVLKEEITIFIENHGKEIINLKNGSLE